MVSTGRPLPPSLAQRFPVLVIAQVESNTAVARSADAIRESLEARDLQVILAPSLEDGETAISADPTYSCIIVAWGLRRAAPEEALQVIQLARRRTAGVPILLAMSKASRSRVPLEFAENMDMRMTPFSMD